MMEKKGISLKGKPTIQNRFKKLKHWYHSTVLMRSSSGFGWDEQNLCVHAEKPVWDNFIEKIKSCKSYNHVPFPQFYDLAPVFANGRANGNIGLSGNDPEVISESGDSSEDDEEEPAIPLHEMNTPAGDEAMYNIINEGVEAKTRNSTKRPAPNSTAGPSEKKKKKRKGQGGEDDDRIVEISGEMKHMRPLIEKAAETIARALGESEEHNVMRRDLRMNLDKVEGLNRIQKVLAFRRLNSNPSDLKSFYDIPEEEKLTLVLDLLGQ